MKKKPCALATVLLVLCLLAACGSSSYISPASDNSTAVMASVPSENEETGEVPLPEAESQEYGYVTDSDLSGSVLQNVNTKLIYRASIELETTEFETSVSRMTDLVSGMNGYIESSYINNYSSYRYGNYTIRIPSENFEDFCSACGQLCQLNYISRSAEDISESYYDTESRLETQKTKLERLQELLAQAENMEDIITIESAISETELNIERLTGTLRKYDSLVGYSTIDLSISEVYTLTEIEQPVIGFGAKLSAAFKSGCTGFVRGMQSLLLAMARGWVSIIIIIAVVVIVLKILKNRAKRRKEAYDHKDNTENK